MILALPQLFKERSLHVVVFGAARSGLSATKLLLDKGHRVDLVDDSSLMRLRYLKESGLSENERLCFAFNGSYQMTRDVDCIVVSPGISPNHALLECARKQGILIISEIDLGMIFVDNAKLIGITGTNGKSTTTMMMESILNVAGMQAVACGNLGRPFTDVVQGQQTGQRETINYIVLELSSFQLESSALLRLDASIIVNITPDHLDRHASFKEYREAKLKIAEPKKTLVANESLRMHLPHARFFSGMEYEHSFNHIPMRGLHNQENAMAAATLARELGIADNVIARGLMNFKALPHRCEIILERCGRIFVNDSKGTTVEAVKKALLSFTEPTHLLLGGIAKGEDFAALSRKDFAHIKNYYVYGRDQQKILSELKIPVAQSFNDLSAATLAAIKNSEPGDLIMLSPGCASYDQFDDYEHRGETFRQLASLLTDNLCAS